MQSDICEVPEGQRHNHQQWVWTQLTSDAWKYASFIEGNIMNWPITIYLCPTLQIIRTTKLCPHCYPLMESVLAQAVGPVSSKQRGPSRTTAIKFQMAIMCSTVKTAKSSVNTGLLQDHCILGNTTYTHPSKSLPSRLLAPLRFPPKSHGYLLLITL